jgi:hypothetical protein
MVLLPVLLIGGLAGAGLMGVVNIPGLTPARGAGAEKLYTEEAEGAKTEGAKAAPAQPPASGLRAGADGTRMRSGPQPDFSRTPAGPHQGADQARTGSGPQPDLDAGARRVARLWAQIETPRLLQVVEDWPDEDLARVIGHLEAGKAAELLSAMDPRRASRLSREIQRTAAAPRPKE